MYKLIFIILMIFFNSSCSLIIDEVKFIVKDKYVKKMGIGKNVSDKFFIVGKFGNDTLEVFTNSDQLCFGKFNSSDVQARLDIGKTVCAMVTGFRIPFLSSYRNIVKVNDYRE